MQTKFETPQRKNASAKLREHGRLGHLLYLSGAFLLEGTVEQDDRRGYSFVVQRLADLEGAIKTARPRAARPRGRADGRGAG